MHFFIQTKLDASEPWVMAGLFTWLMGWRLLAWRGLLAGGRSGIQWRIVLARLTKGGMAPRSRKAWRT